MAGFNKVKKAIKLDLNKLAEDDSIISVTPSADYLQRAQLPKDVKKIFFQPALDYFFRLFFSFFFRLFLCLLFFVSKSAFFGGDMKGQSIMSGFDISSKDRMCPKCFLKFLEREDEFDNYEKNTALDRFLKIINGEINIEDLQYMSKSSYFKGNTVSFFFIHRNDNN